MPCRCDGYEVTASDVRRELGPKIEHLEGQLCNAQSLIHKLLKHIDSLEAGGPSKLKQELRERAEAHIQVLLAHKKAEHQSDVDAIKRQLQSAERTLDQQQRQVKGQQEGMAKTQREIAHLRQQMATVSELTDEEILG